MFVNKVLSWKWKWDFFWPRTLRDKRKPYFFRRVGFRLVVAVKHPLDNSWAKVASFTVEASFSPRGAFGRKERKKGEKVFFSSSLLTCRSFTVQRLCLPGWTEWSNSPDKSCHLNRTTRYRKSGRISAVSTFPSLALPWHKRDTSYRVQCASYTEVPA